MCSAGSPESAKFKMGSTRLGQGFPSRLKEEKLPPCTGCPETACLSAEPNILLSTGQSQEMLLLTEAQSHFSWRHRLMLTGNRKHWGEQSIACGGQSPLPWALGAEASSEADLSWAPAVHLPKGFLHHLVPERKSHMVTTPL